MTTSLGSFVHHFVTLSCSPPFQFSVASSQKSSSNSFASFPLAQFTLCIDAPSDDRKARFLTRLLNLFHEPWCRIKWINTLEFEWLPCKLKFHAVCATSQGTCLDIEGRKS